MKNGNTNFFILFTANFIVAILSACAYIFSWTLLIPFILLTIVVCALNCAMLKSPKQNAICFIPTIVSAIATSIVGVTISFDLINLMFLSSQIAILLFMTLISTIVKFKATHNDFQLQKSTQIIITIVLFCWIFVGGFVTWPTLQDVWFLPFILPDLELWRSTAYFWTKLTSCCVPLWCAFQVL